MPANCDWHCRPFLCLRRGVSAQKAVDASVSALFSAYAEVFLPDTTSNFGLRPFLCLRRGVSKAFLKLLLLTALFSAYAEVFPRSALSRSACINFSLPTQRCFRFGGVLEFSFPLFSAYAEVFPRRGARISAGKAFLCLRRGVSEAHMTQIIEKTFSLPTQRCFYRQLHRSRCHALFSAYAEVFPCAGVDDAIHCPFLCLRRGVSRANTRLSTMVRFSLPTQRCFRVL